MQKPLWHLRLLQTARVPGRLSLPQQLEHFLDQCVSRHNAIDLMKTYDPELFVRHRLSRPVPNPKELGLK